MTTFLDEAQVELVVLDILGELGWPRAFGPDIAFDGERPERASYGDVVLVGRLREALARINPKVPEEAIEEAVRKITRTESPSMVENNRRFHRMLTEGVPVEYHAGGRIVHEPLWLVDFADPDNNDWLAVNQFTVVEDRRNRRADVVLFINGLPLVVIELKNPADENATIKHAFNQFQTYKRDIPALFTYNELLAISDGLEARLGTLTADWERFMPWRTIDGREVAPASQPQLDVLLRGAFDRERLLDLIRFFVVFEDDGAKVVKKAAAYHQYHAVNKAVACTVQAAAPKGNRQIGVVWHTQGSGKSLSMAFYSGKIIQHPLMSNPTLVVLTDRNDLDDQLFGTFAACKELLRQKPVQAESRSHLRELLSVAAGGVVFTTIQKFMPEIKGDSYPLLSDRRNIVVIADEAHRSQYDFIDGFARHLRDAVPNASFIGFTGTPIEGDDRSTPAVFGNYIDVYDIQRAVEDGATVRIYYEGRLAKIELVEEERPKIAQDLVEAVRRSVTIDWTVRESARASIRGIVRRILRRYTTRPIAGQDGDAVEHRLHRHQRSVLHQRGHEQDLRGRQELSRIRCVGHDPQILRAAQVDPQLRQEARLDGPLHHQQGNVRSPQGQHLRDAGEDMDALAGLWINECHILRFSVGELHPSRIEHQRQLQTRKPNRIPVVLPTEVGWHDHVVRRLERPCVAIAEVVQGEHNGNVQPLDELLHRTRHRIATVSPDHVRVVLRQENLAGREECLDLLVIDPAAAGRGRVEQRYRNLFVSGEDHPPLVRPYPHVADLVADAPPGQHLLDENLFPGVQPRTAKCLALEAQPLQELQPIQRGCRRPVREVDHAMRRDEGDLLGAHALKERVRVRAAVQVPT